MTPLQKVREKQKKSRKEVCTDLDIDVSTLYRIETAQSLPSVELAARLAAYFNHEIDERHLLYPSRYMSTSGQAA